MYEVICKAQQVPGIVLGNKVKAPTIAYCVTGDMRLIACTTTRKLPMNDQSRLFPPQCYLITYFPGILCCQPQINTQINRLVHMLVRHLALANQVVAMER